MFQIEKLKEIVGCDNVKTEEPMSKHTSFRIGGNASVYVTPVYIEDFAECIFYLKSEQQDYIIVGNGSNLLVSDEGYQGVVVSTRGIASKNTDICADKTPVDVLEMYQKEDLLVDDYLAACGYKDLSEFEGKNFIYAGSGVLLSKMAAFIAEQSLTGFEFAGGIPGTLGGAVTMDAGAYGGEIKDVILGARVLGSDGEIKYLSKEDMQLSYRNSIIQKENMIVLDALFVFEKGDKTKVKSYMNELNQKRRDKQPLEYGSAGSTFKRPEGYFAGKLIEDAGLKGYRVGDVMVSEKHCGFVVNVGNGTFKQAMQVIEHVQEEVYMQFGVKLELEVKLV